MRTWLTGLALVAVAQEVVVQVLPVMDRVMDWE